MSGVTHCWNENPQEFLLRKSVSCLIWCLLDYKMEFVMPISIMVFLNLFLIFRLIYMASSYVKDKEYQSRAIQDI